MHSQKKINVVVVTYNRSKLLMECLAAIINQSYPTNEIIVVDNNSTDETLSVINETYQGLDYIKVIHLRKNYGGAGGFYCGIRAAYQSSCDYVWVMDDDTIPAKTSLEELVNAYSLVDNKASFMASTVYGIQNECMNTPAIDLKKDDNGYSYWFKYLEKGMVSVESATFVSLLINVDAIRKCGAPHPDFFIWGDDTEYTLRLTKSYAPAYLVGASKVLHKRVGGEIISLKKENNINRINLYACFYTNNLVIKKTYFSTINRYKFEILMLKEGIELILSKDIYKFLKMKALIKGYSNYILGKYGLKNFNDRYHNMDQNLINDYEEIASL